jgi:hypothetical protein
MRRPPIAHFDLLLPPPLPFLRPFPSLPPPLFHPQVTQILTAQGFDVESIATEREKNPAGRSEVSMIYARRQGALPPLSSFSSSSSSSSSSKAKGRAAAPASSPARTPVKTDSIAAAREAASAEQARRAAERMGQLQKSGTKNGRARAGSRG